MSNFWLEINQARKFSLHNIKFALKIIVVLCFERGVKTAVSARVQEMINIHHCVCKGAPSRRDDASCFTLHPATKPAKINYTMTCPSWFILLLPPSVSHLTLYKYSNPRYLRFIYKFYNVIVSRQTDTTIVVL